MKITKVTTERTPPGAHDYVVAARIEGEELEPRAAPLMVKFGDVSARRVVPLLSADGVRALFSEMPPIGAPLSIGYLDEPLQETEFEFVAPADEPIA